MEDYVICEICGEKKKALLTNGHLKKHNITTPEYKKKFPKAKIVCGSLSNLYKEKIKKSKIYGHKPTKKEIKKGLEKRKETYKNKPNWRADCANKNLTPEVLEKRGKAISKVTKGKSHSKEHNKAVAVALLKFHKNNPGFVAGKNNPMYGVPCPKGAGIGKKFKVNTFCQGVRWVKSSYEKAYIDYLNKNKIKYVYEPKRFKLTNTTYCPDFYLIDTNEYIEVKGYETKSFIEKFKEFKQKYNFTINILYKKDLEELGCEV